MKAMKWMTALAAVGTLGIVSSQAAAVVCYSPALGFFSDIVKVHGNQQVNVTCSSRPTGGAVTNVTGRSSTSSQVPKSLGANLTLGPGYARVGGYGANRVGLGCFALDTNPTTNSVVFVTCSANVVFVDMEIGS